MGMLKGIAMVDLLLLSEAQVRRIKPYFTLSHGNATVLRSECAGQCATCSRIGQTLRRAPAMERSNKRTPRSSSISLMRLLTIGCLTLNSFAAALKLPLRATATTERR
jgi:hypothetical protein